MPIYRYSTIGSAPRGVESEIEAPDRATALRRLMRQGLAPVSIEAIAEEVQPGESRGAARAEERTHASAAARPRSVGRGGRGGGGGVSRGQFVSFIRELATAVNAGLPLVQSLRTIARPGGGDGRRVMLGRLIEEVEHGRSLSEAMAAWGRPCTELVISLVHAGEVAGRLGEVLTQAARLLERDAKTRAALMGALLYPMIVAGAVSIAVVVVVTVIVPRVLAAAAGQITVMPMPTRVVQAFSSMVAGWWWVILPAAVAGVWGMRRLYRREESRLVIDGALLRLPLVGPALRDAAVARFTRTLSALLGAGLPVIMALRVTRGALGNRAMERAIDGVCERVASGRTIAEPMEQCGLFPALLVQIVSLGEQTGRLDETLAQASTAFEDRTEQSLRLVTTILPPALIVTLAVVVGFVVLAILLPLLELQESIG